MSHFRRNSLKIFSNKNDTALQCTRMPSLTLAESLGSMSLLNIDLPPF